jgi:hypothetical protein
MAAPPESPDPSCRALPPDPAAALPGRPVGGSRRAGAAPAPAPLGRADALTGGAAA